MKSSTHIRHVKLIRHDTQEEWTTRVVLSYHDTDQGGMTATPVYRATYTDETGERKRDTFGLSVVEWQALASKGHGADSPMALDVALAGLLCHLVSLYGPCAIMVRADRARAFRPLRTLEA